MAKKTKPVKSTKPQKATPVAEAVIVSDTGDDAQGEAELANSLRDTPDEAAVVVFETESLSREERDERDDPEFFEEALKFELIEAEREQAKAAKAAPNRMDKPGSVLPPTANFTKSSKSKKLSAEEAGEIVNRLFVSFIESGLVDYAPIVPFFEALAYATRQMDEKGKVAKILGIRAAYLWSALEILEKLASDNLARIGKDRNSKEFYANRKNLWIGLAIDQAKFVLNLKHSTLLPVEGVEFKPQWMDADLRNKIQDLLVELVKVVKFATCANDGKAVGIDRNGNPYTLCVSCRDAKLKAEKTAAELRELNLKLEEKNNLLRPLYKLLAEMDLAGSSWVLEQVAQQRREVHAQMAYDVKFNPVAKNLLGQVKTLASNIQLGKITEEDLNLVADVAEQIKAAISQIKSFRQKDWCSTCGVPVYSWLGKHGEPVGPFKDCTGCHRLKKVATTPVEAVISDDDQQAIKEDLGMVGIVLEVGGQVIQGGSQAAPKPQFSTDYTDELPVVKTGRTRRKSKPEIDLDELEEGGLNFERFQGRKKKAK